MKTRLYLLLWFIPLVLFGSSAEAAYSCSITSGGVSSTYDPALATATAVQSSVNISCSRLSTDPSPVTFSLGTNNGLQPQGQANRAAFGANLLGYDLYQNSACSTLWKAAQPISVNFNFNGALTASMSVPYWGCITAGQTGKPAGTYSDSVALTLTYSGLTAPTNASVNITTPWTCSISAAPATLNFGTYVAYGTALNVSTSFGVTCTNYLPYTLAVSPTSGTLYGLAYTLAVSTPSNTGTGAQQTLTIDGSMGAGQAGTCATGTCTGTNNPHTLTLTY